MNREDAHKLLGGYATGTLTPEEQQALFAAALEDQELFDALAREQALREVLGDPAARAQLLAALDEAPASWLQRWWRPLLPVTVMAAALVVGVVSYRPSLPDTPNIPLPVRTAKLEPPQILPAAPPPVLPAAPTMTPAQPASAPLQLPIGVPAPPPPPAAVAKDERLAVAVDGAAADTPKQMATRGFVAGEPGAIGGLAGNAFAARTVVVHGRVTDPTGGAVPSATVEVRSLATGAMNRVPTNAQGEYTAVERPGDNYQIQVTAPGFRVATASLTIPPAGVPDPVNLRLEVGPATETVEVTAAATTLAAAGRGGRGGGGGGRGGGAALNKQAPAAAAGPAAAPQAPTMQAQQSQQSQPMQAGSQAVTGSLASPRAQFKTAEEPAPLSLQTRVMRRMPRGEMAELPADGTVAPGATLILQITANAAGFVRVTQRNGHQVAAGEVASGQRFEKQLPKFNKKERVDLTVVFTPGVESKKAAQNAIKTPPGTPLSGAAAAGSIQTTITLNVR